MKTTIIFDFDGTLINTNDLIEAGLNEFALQARGKALSKGEQLLLLGRPLQEQMAYIDPESAEALTEAFKAWYLEAHASHVKLFDGVLELLNHLKAMGYPMAVVSNNSRETIAFGMNQFNMAHYFDLIVSCDDVKFKKPDPEGLIMAMTCLGVEPDQCLFVGDSANDLLAAQAAGVEDVLVAWTAGDQVSLRALAPAHVIDQPQALLHLLGETKTSLALKKLYDSFAEAI